MLLKLIPALSEPTIHFSLSFADLPDNLPTPATWAAQLAQLMHEDLETPTTLHSLDRSAGVTSLLEEVELDIAMGEIRCRFIDGNVERWGFWEGVTAIGAFKDGDSSQYGKRLSDALERIIKDVNESTLEDERITREREWEKKRVERTRSVSSVTAASVAKAGKFSRHKKSRSFFMSIVSAVGSIINLSSPSSSNNTSSTMFISRPSVSYSSNPPTSPSTPSGPTGTSPRARALRRAARSALVDTYRLFVLTELVHRIPGPSISINTLEALPIEVQRPQEYRRQEPISFCIWILHSMRRRILERMEQILEEAEAELGVQISALDAASNAMGPRSMCDENSGFEPTTMIVPMSFSDDEEEPVRDLEMGLVDAPPTPVDGETDVDSDWDTETDGSSVHTPSTTSHFQCYPGRSMRTSSRSSNTSSSSSSSTSDDPECVAVMPSPPVPPKDFPETQADPQSSALAPRRRSTIRLLVSEPAQPVQPAQRLSSPALEEYRHLMDSRKRLAQLLLFAASQSRVANEEAQNRLEILAVRSRRRAWSNRALSMEAKSRTGLGGSAAYGLATPFRSSMLGRYMWTADDLANREETSSAESSPASSLSRYSGLTAFPSYRPKLRPKVRLDVEAVLGVQVHDTSFVDGEEEDDEEAGSPQAYPLVTDKSNMYEQLKGSSHEKRVTNRKVSMSARSPPVDRSRSVIGRLFPVSEEMEGEVQDHYPNDEQVFEFALHGKTTYKKDRATHTFMGCDEVRVDDDEEDLEQAMLLTYSGEEEEEVREFDIEDGFGEFGDREVPFDVDSVMAGVQVIEPPKTTTRVRTTSMMGVFLQRAKGMQSSFQSNHRRTSEQQFELTKDSLLCQGVPVSVVLPSPSTVPASPPQLQTQSQVRFKRTNPPLPSQDNQKAIKIARTSSPAIYTNIEVNMLDVQVYDSDSTDYSQDKDQAPFKMCSNQSSEEEFTLSMDVPKRNHHRRRESRPHEYPTRPLSRHEFDDNRRPKLNTIFIPPVATQRASNPLIPC